MSYDLFLKRGGKTINLAENHQYRGGTYCIGGTTEARLNVTYNYSKHFYRVLGEKGIRSIYGMTGEAAIPVLEAAAAKMADDVDDDYWKATEGNARKALMDLVALARLAPDGVWDGD